MEGHSMFTNRKTQYGQDVSPFQIDLIDSNAIPIKLLANYTMDIDTLILKFCREANHPE